jgi:hypothetical protein
MTDERTTAYLLDELPQDEAEQFEEQCFSQPEWPEMELEAAEEDLIQAYVKDELSPERRLRFEENYLTTEARKERVLLAKSFLQVVCSVSQPTPAPTPTWTQRVIGFLKSLVFAPGSAVPRFATVVVTLGLAAALLWLSFRTTPPQTFAHLNLAISYDARAGSSQVQRVKLPLPEDALRISLALPQPAQQGVTHRVQWEDIRRPLGDLDIEKQDANSISVIIPAGKLTIGQYTLKLFRKNPDGTEERLPGNYLFNVD